MRIVQREMLRRSEATLLIASDVEEALSITTQVLVVAAEDLRPARLRAASQKPTGSGMLG